VSTGVAFSIYGRTFTEVEFLVGWVYQIDNFKKSIKTFRLELIDIDVLFAHIVERTAALGFDFASFGMQMPLPLNNPKIVTRNNYDPEWWNVYLKNNYFQIDPVVIHVRTSDEAAVWSDNFFSAQPKFWEHAQSFGLRYGWTKATRSSVGTMSQLSFSRRENPLSEQELLLKESAMIDLADLAHLHMTECFVLEQFPESKTELSQRERDVIRWCADGKTNAEIAMILNISTSSVNFHVLNFIKKLDASNKTHAVMKAASFGLLGRPGG
jgi:LuxR family quorum-sensing system transcriptional regulator SolR